jgi:hypothetical protein
MGRRISVRTGLVALVTAFALVPASTLGDQPLTQHHHATHDVSVTVCGIPVDATVVSTRNTFVYADGTFRGTISVRTTYTNPANGQSVIVSTAGQMIGSTTVDEEAGTITLVSSLAGLPDKVETANGPVLLFDAGFLSFVTTISFNGDLLSEQVIVNGPHPQFDDATLFCDVFTAALT